MALIYGLVCTFMAVLHKLAAWRHNRIKLAYQQIETQFSELENQCKADEVSMGRPMDYQHQIDLLKLFEQKERKRKAWIQAERLMARRHRRVNWLRQLRGRRLPYTFGLIDMALVMKTIDFGRYFNSELTSLHELIRSIF